MKIKDIKAIQNGTQNYTVEISGAPAGPVYHGNSLDDARWHLGRQLEKAVAEEYNLKDYNTWKAWLLADQVKYDNHDYRDNWLFAETDTISHELIQNIDAFGTRWLLVKSFRRHRICRKEFVAYEVFDDETFLCCRALCGFQYKENTKINYLYRDADNYKMQNECVIKGEITPEQIAVILSCLNTGEFFIPEQVGMPAMRFSKYDPQSDHPWMELQEDSFEPTSCKPTIDMTAEELVNQFLERKNNWEEKGRNFHGYL